MPGQISVGDLGQNYSGGNNGGCGYIRAAQGRGEAGVRDASFRSDYSCGAPVRGATQPQLPERRNVWTQLVGHQ
jgi:hypothetical protein